MNADPSLLQENVTDSSINRNCFVISPIGDEGSETRMHADAVFEFIIKPAMANRGIKATRSDQLMESGRITDQMFREIIKSDLCIAVLTGFNPNVFYELAVAQCAAVPVIVLVEKGVELPFDVKDLRSVQYSLKPILELVQGDYAKMVEDQVVTFEKQGWRVDSLFDQYGHLPKMNSEYQIRRLLNRSSPKPLPEKISTTYKIPAEADQGNNEDRFITILHGDIINIKNKLGIGADVIVNLLDANLQQSRFYDRSISGVLRYYDADLSGGGGIENDTLTEQLQKRIGELNITLPVISGASVIETPTNKLKDRGFNHVFHIGAKEGTVGQGYSLRSETIGLCIHSAYEKFDQLVESGEADISSMMIPMLGAGSTNLNARDVARSLMLSILNELKSHTYCVNTYIVAWLDSHRLSLEDVIKELRLVEEIK